MDKGYEKQQFETLKLRHLWLKNLDVFAKPCLNPIHDHIANDRVF